ncbi:ThuA domain-containing protein [Streptomyces sp. DK15]|uniref:ThuA domain-containing protein n=1 Tax=Streptomyces sp. DK15 TaxID=2957499 RepID=UPI0029B9F13E|nr:ThuA domain-containing protein [Streptomyces sp. DK15]MDX2393557.1 ThuA domain-containing protein [Streptomyces sp. DK15]
MPTSDVLVYTRTAGYRHDSIPAGADAFVDLSRHVGLEAAVTDDPAEFTGERLERCVAVVLLSTTGSVFTDPARSALESYVRRGGGLLAVHAAANAEPGWPFFGDLLGTRFAGHPPLQPGLVHVEDTAHPATAHLPAEWAWTDEWYDFTSPPRDAGVHILLRADESTYRGGTHGADHPLSWCHEKAGGRFFFTALGHTSESYTAPAFRAHLSGALHWAASRR